MSIAQGVSISLTTELTIKNFEQPQYIVLKLLFGNPTLNSYNLANVEIRGVNRDTDDQCQNSLDSMRNSKIKQFAVHILLYFFLLFLTTVIFAECTLAKSLCF